MLILQIRQAETALKDGRLDEAFELVHSEAVRRHCRGQHLIGRVARALVQRGRTHLAAGLCEQAMIDAEKGTRLAGHLPEAAELRRDIQAAIMARQDQRHRQAEVIATAREHLHNGRLSMGANVLEEVADADGPIITLTREIMNRRGRAEALLEQAERAIGQEDWDAAVDALLEVKGLHTSNARLAEIIVRVRAAMLDHTRRYLDGGRLDLAEAVLDKLVPLAGKAVEVREAERILHDCRRAVGLIERRQLRTAGEILQRLAPLLPQADWLARALTNVQQAATALEHLRGGPLGLIVGDKSLSMGEYFRGHDTMVSADLDRVEKGSPVSSRPLPDKSIMHVDGAGSFLLLRGRKVHIGPAGGAALFDVALMADSSLPAVTIERREEDYFLESAVPVEVNGTPVTHRLLSGGERIALSPRCRLKFERPNAASTSAILSLSGTRLPDGDARQIVLFDKSIIIGPGSSAHIRAGRTAQPIVLYLRDQGLYARSSEPVVINGKAAGATEALPVEKQVCIGEVSFVITPT